MVHRLLCSGLEFVFIFPTDCDLRLTICFVAISPFLSNDSLCYVDTTVIHCWFALKDGLYGPSAQYPKPEPYNTYVPIAQSLFPALKDVAIVCLISTKYENCSQFCREWLFVRLKTTVPLFATAHFAPTVQLADAAENSISSGQRKLRFITSWAGDAAVVWVVFLYTAMKL